MADESADLNAVRKEIQRLTGLLQSMVDRLAKSNEAALSKKTEEPAWQAYPDGPPSEVVTHYEHRDFTGRGVQRGRAQGTYFRR